MEQEYQEFINWITEAFSSALCEVQKDFNAEGDVFDIIHVYNVPRQHALLFTRLIEQYCTDHMSLQCAIIEHYDNDATSKAALKRELKRTSPPNGEDE